MKINPLDAHDRLLHLSKTQALEIDECCQDLMKKRPYGEHPFYIFVHPRTDDDGSSKRLIWQDRLSRPKPQTNSMLFKAYPVEEFIRLIWIIPPREIWPQYQKGLLTSSQIVWESIYDFENHREELGAPAEDDPPHYVMQELTFQYKPWLFQRDTLPPEKRGIWDQKMAERERLKLKSEEASKSVRGSQADIPPSNP